MTRGVMKRTMTTSIVAALAAAWLSVCTPAAAVTADALMESANAGRFDEVAKSLSTEVRAEDPRVTALLGQIESFQTHRQRDLETRAEAYRKTIDEMVENAGKDDLYEALVSAIKAHDLAIDPAAMLSEPPVDGLVTRTKQSAEQAMAGGDWLEAINLYRALDLLFEEEGGYREQVKRAVAHVRLLRMYSPHALHEMTVERAKRRGKDAPKELAAEEDEGWEKQLEGVEAMMLRAALKHAQRRHVHMPSLQKLLGGAIDALEILGKTPATSETFPAMAEQAKVAQFLSGLTAERQRIAAIRRMSFWDAIESVDRMVELNRQTLILPEKVIVYEMTQGMTSTLDDFSSVIWPYDQEQFSRNTSGKFFGVGIQISLRDDRLIVVTPLHGTPAFKAGIKPGDVIAEVDARDTTDWSLDKAVREITGPKDTVVTLGIQRAGRAELVNIPLKRAEIPIESVKGWEIKPDGTWDHYLDRASKIGYVRLSQFIPQSADDIDAAISRMENDAGLDALVLDLRFNPGGLLTSAIEVTDRFIARGDIVSTVDVDGIHTNRFRARPEKTHRDLPLIVLINQGSASASEIVAGALQDHGRALIVGERTFGKGSVQDLISLTQDRTAFLKLTTQYYALPSKRIIHREPGAKTWGVEPDLRVRMTDDQVAAWLEARRDADILANGEDVAPPPDADKPKATAGRILEESLDPQLDSALLILRTRLVAQATGLASKD